MNYIIILSGPSIRASGKPGTYTPIDCLRSRLDRGLEVWSELTGGRCGADKVRIIVTGHNDGQGCFGPTSAQIMKQYLSEHQVPADHIIEEPLAKNTIENAIHSLQLLAPATKSLYVITSDFHIERARRIFEYFMKLFGISLLTGYVGATSSIEKEKLQLLVRNEKEAIGVLHENLEYYRSRYFQLRNELHDRRNS